MEDRFIAPAAQGSYMLLLLSSQRCSLTVGRLGRKVVDSGWYLYVGSALGPGGLRGRLRHHLQPAQRLHWHIDHLRRVCELRAIWFAVGAERWEHRWAQMLTTLGTFMPVPGFGASDCRCVSHCFFLTQQPTLVQLQRQLHHFYPGHPILHELAPTHS
ncbi:MAG: GIY-YIG nuclease family protein [Caldilinea sp.]|nr:GIY-YIG nuclease family protein [Caldilinea sp.]MDW8441560.1 GIY-YIG nuclease family protein [Caldilineaceae bacterium]